MPSDATVAFGILIICADLMLEEELVVVEDEEDLRLDELLLLLVTDDTEHGADANRRHTFLLLLLLFAGTPVRTMDVPALSRFAFDVSNFLSMITIGEDDDEMEGIVLFFLSPLPLLLVTNVTTDGDEEEVFE